MIVACVDNVHVNKQRTEKSGTFLVVQGLRLCTLNARGLSSIVDNVHVNKQTAEKKWNFPGGPVARTLHSQCQGPEFDPWSGN